MPSTRNTSSNGAPKRRATDSIRCRPAPARRRRRAASRCGGSRPCRRIIAGDVAWVWRRKVVGWNGERSASAVSGKEARMQCTARLLTLTADRSRISRWIKAPILDRFGKIRGVNTLAPREIGDRARDAQHAVVGARGKAEPLDRAIEQRLRSRIERAIALGFAIARARSSACPRARAGVRARRSRVRARRRSTSPRCARAKFGLRDARHFELQVDAIEQRAGDARAIALRSRRACSGSGPTRRRHSRTDTDSSRATSWNRAGNSAWRAAREIAMRPDSSGSRKTSSTCRSNSGSSSRNSTP